MVMADVGRSEREDRSRGRETESEGGRERGGDTSSAPNAASLTLFLLIMYLFHHEPTNAYEDFMGPHQPYNTI
jgi:hypothetical protein